MVLLTTNGNVLANSVYSLTSLNYSLARVCNREFMKLFSFIGHWICFFFSSHSINIGFDDILRVSNKFFSAFSLFVSFFPFE